MTGYVQSLSEQVTFFLKKKKKGFITISAAQRSQAPWTQPLINFMLKVYNKETRMAGEAGYMVTTANVGKAIPGARVLTAAF